MSDSPNLPPSLDEPVGVVLARWRKERKLSGQALGELVGMSQAKISRLETGVSIPDMLDVRRIAEALELPAAEVSRLVALTDRPSDQLIDWQSAEPDLPHRQHFVRQLEANAKEIRTFQPSVFVGLIQTSEYARAVLTGLQAQQADDHNIAEKALAVSETVAARIQRSQVLYETDRQFFFVMAESVLSNQVCRPADMLAQIARLREVAALPNVNVRIVPESAIWPVAALHGFELMGDRCVMIDLYNTGLLSRGRQTIRYYRRVFDAYESVATSDIEPILDAHQKRYVRLLPGAAA
ncbi:helix-turn-helix domain-containing protein [Paractinoplanes hotanensis]|uniref:Helix-turn-helix transcriptional regulator n=1 Tax=Paractinoplanes hotanensis TaxID=2906497 RepID=A0ABT0YFF2_9ACTN|nr:helix-turn-helix transcriptional regulator [Actinoplanes hotanensis]MCM4084777.1 helix-turn-helix transcriptional regulator [Actinoplanes hotanensis]